jgi:hypothetical protein
MLQVQLILTHQKYFGIGNKLKILNKIIMKKISIYSLLIVTVSMFSSCLKDKGFENNEYGLKPNEGYNAESVKILQGGTTTGDINAQKLNFADDAASLDSSSFNVIYVNSATANPIAKTTINITLGVDDAFRVAYNADPTNATKFDAMPDSTYSFTATATTIAAGQTMSPTLKIYFKPNKFDPSKLYMLPVVIKTVSNGIQIQKNYGYVIFSKIGNPIAGKYLWDFKRWNIPTQSVGEPTIAPNGGTFINDDTKFSPLDGTTILVESGYFIQPRYQLSFTLVNNVPSNFSAIIYGPDNDALIAAGVTVVEGPNILIADPVTKRYKLQYQVFNGTAYRYIIDEFHQ